MSENKEPEKKDRRLFDRGDACFGYGGDNAGFCRSDLQRYSFFKGKIRYGVSGADYHQ